MQQLPDMGELIRLAQTPAGKQLISMLQSKGSTKLQQAISSAASGDYTRVREVLSDLLSDPEAQALLKELEEHR